MTMAPVALFLLVLLSFCASDVHVCFGSLYELSESEVFNALETSCVVAVTERASAELYNSVQYTADVSFTQDNGVVIGFVPLENVRWTDELRDNKDLVKTEMVYFKRRVEDRTCLLKSSLHNSNLHHHANPVPQAALASIAALVAFINKVCNVNRATDGGISSAGLHRQYILNNLFYVENVTNVSMGHLYSLTITDNESKNITQKNDNSYCFSKKSKTFVDTEESKMQCTQSDGKNTINRPTVQEKSVQNCEKIDMPTFTDFFEKYLKKSQPVIIKNVTKNWPAFNKWSNKFLRDRFGEVRVHIKLSPTGEYEGVEHATLWEDFESFKIPSEVKAQLPYPDLVVVRPATMDIKFSEFLDLVANISSGTVKNISAYLEYTSMAEYFKDILEDTKEMPFISDILTLKHQNIWLSDGNTLGKLHFDPFDNFLCQLSGQKELLLFSPHNNTKLYESHIPEAILSFNKTTSTFRRRTLLESTSMVMSPVDPLNPDFKRFPGFADAFPMNCTISEGDVLYLPAFWWHEVQSRPSQKEHRNLAVNFWYEPFLTREFPCPECSLDVNPTYSHLL